MRKPLILVLVVLLSLIGGRAFADAAPQAGANNGPQKLWVPVFAETGNIQSPSWVGKTVRQALLDELSGLRSIEVMAADVTPKDSPSAVVEAKKAGASYVVTGTCQVVDSEVRITGRVTDTNSGRILGAFKATGAQRDLFAIEDSLSAQIRRIVAPREAPAMPEPVAETDVAPRPAAARPAAAFEGSDLQQAVRNNRNFTDVQLARDYNPTPAYYPPDYSYQPVGYSPYAYSPFGYGYGYYGWTPSVIVINNSSNRRGHSDGGHHGNFGGGDGHHGNFGGGGGAMPAPSGNGQAIRQVASFSGNPPNGVSMTVQNPPSLVVGHR